FLGQPPATNFSTLSLHGALPMSGVAVGDGPRSGVDERGHPGVGERPPHRVQLLDARVVPADLEVDLEEPGPRVDRPDHVFLHAGDRKSTRLNSSHVKISYAVFCL